jgi:small-conductance mechanosensitive channel
VGDWFRLVIQEGAYTSLGGVDLIIALILLILLRILLPETERARIRLPLLFFIGNVVIVVFRSLVAIPDGFDRPLGAVALVLILASIGRASFLLLVDYLIGRRLARPLPKIFRDIIQVLVYLGVAFLTLPYFGVEPGSLLTTSALITAVIGLSLQETLGNLFAGLAIQAQRPFEVGDWIRFDLDESLTGRVTEINWRATKVMTDAQVEVIVPNGPLAKAPISNYTQPTRVSRREVSVQAEYEAAPHQVMRALLDAVHATPDVLNTPAPDVVLHQYDDSGLEYRLRYYIRDFARRVAIDSAVRVRIWYAFQRANLTIPFPIRDVRSRDVATERTREAEDTQSARQRALQGIDFLAGLPEDVMAQLVGRTRVALYSDGETVIRQGDAGDELFIVNEGEVAILVGKTEVARLGSGKFFGEMSLLTGEKRTATVTSCGPARLFVIGSADMKELLEQDPTLAEHLAEVLARRKAQLEEQKTGTPPSKRKEQAESSVLLSRIRSFFSL